MQTMSSICRNDVYNMFTHLHQRKTDPAPLG